ncbi:transposase [Streptomyces sp. NPDC048404]|uniref:transposase n=1 Tax=unclassified Streptomyces TaxID=2593676 RepID=UPI00341E23D0
MAVGAGRGRAASGPVHGPGSALDGFSGPSTLIVDTLRLDLESRRGVPGGTYKYSAEFRADAVELVRSAGRPVSQIAGELGVNHETLRQWVKTADKRSSHLECSVGFRCGDC